MLNAMLQIKCRVCGSNDFKQWGCKNGSILYQCKHCELVFFYPYPSQKQLDDFYTNSSYHQKRGYSGQNQAGELRKLMYGLDIADLEKHIPGGGKFLDVGCAEGLFLSHLKSAKWECYGMDVSETALEEAKRQTRGIHYFNAGIETIPTDDCFFDVIHMRGVFEHLLHPDGVIKALKKKLKIGGLLVLSNTPNIKSICAILYRGRFKLVLPNEHVNYFSLKTIKVLSKNNNFSIKHVSYPYFGSPYESFFGDSFNLFRNLITGEESPPYWGSIFTLYLKRR